MGRRRARLTTMLLALLLAGWSVNDAVAAKSPEYLFKVATLAPAGSIWAVRFQDFIDEVKSRSGGDLDFKVYYGGIMGDDRAMYRKMQIGQLHAGGFTMTGIGEIVPDFRVMGIPFLFKTYEEADRVQEGIFPLLQKAFARKDLVLLSFNEVGFVYPMSTHPVTTIDEFKKSRIWTPDNDPISRRFLDTLGVTPVTLSIPDVLPSLQTGIIDTVFNGFYGSIVLQWYTKAKYVTDVPFGYAYGGLVFSKRAYEKLPARYSKLIEEALEKHFGQLLLDTRKSNEEALEVLQKNGVTLVEAAPGSMDGLLAIRDTVVNNLLGISFSEEIFSETMKYLEESRNKVKGER